MRAWRLFFLVCSIGGACGGVAPLDVGTNTDTNTDAGATTSAASPSMTLLQTLTAKCEAAQSAGTVDDFNTAAELTQKIRGRWYACPETTQNWNLPTQAALELAFASSGATFQFMALDDAGTDFTPLQGQDESGPLDYLVFTGMEGVSDAGPDGAGSVTTEAFVPWNDDTPQNNINLYFDRVTDNLEFVPELTTNPRKLELRELGGSPAFARFVPVD